MDKDTWVKTMVDIMMEAIEEGHSAKEGFAEIVLAKMRAEGFQFSEKEKESLK
jgi:hypothetical protein